MCEGGSLQAALCQLHLHRQCCIALLLPLLFTLLVVLVLAADALAYVTHCHWLLGLQRIKHSGCMQQTPCNTSAAPEDGI